MGVPTPMVGSVDFRKVERMVTLEQRLMNVEADANQLKGAYEHLATKADLARLEGKFDSDLANLENRLTRWIAGGIGIMVVGLVANIFVQLLAN